MFGIMVFQSNFYIIIMYNKMEIHDHVTVIVIMHDIVFIVYGLISNPVLVHNMYDIVLPINRYKSLSLAYYP